MQRTAREMNLSETVFVLSAGGPARMRTIRIFTPTDRASVRRPSRCSAPRSCSGRSSEAAWCGCGPAAAMVPVSLTREGDRIVFGEMEQPIPTWKPFARAERELLAALGVERLGATGRGLRQRPSPRVRRAGQTRRPWPRSSPDMGALAALGSAERQLLRRERDGGSRRGCSRRGSAWPRIRPLARRPGRSRSIWRGTGGSSSARASRSVRVSRSSGRRVLHARVDGSPEQHRARGRGRRSGGRRARGVPAELTGVAIATC